MLIWVVIFGIGYPVARLIAEAYWHRSKPMRTCRFCGYWSKIPDDPHFENCWIKEVYYSNRKHDPGGYPHP